MANKVTLKQIAQEVGLSPSSVSLVLNKSALSHLGRKPQAHQGGRGAQPLCS